METLETRLADMGHDRSLAAAALRASSNVIERAASCLAEGMPLHQLQEMAHNIEAGDGKNFVPRLMRTRRHSMGYLRIDEEVIIEPRTKRRKSVGSDGRLSLELRCKTSNLVFQKEPNIWPAAPAELHDLGGFCQKHRSVKQNFDAHMEKFWSNGRWTRKRCSARISPLARERIAHRS